MTKDLFRFLFKACLVQSHEDVPAPAVDERALLHAFRLAAKGDESVACSPSHVHRWLLLTRPHKEVLSIVAFIFLTCRSDGVRVIISVDELDFRFAILCLCFLITIGFVFI